MGKKQFLRDARGLRSLQTILLVSRLASYWQKYTYLAKRLSTLVTRSRLQNASQMLKLKKGQNLFFPVPTPGSTAD